MTLPFMSRCPAITLDIAISSFRLLSFFAPPPSQPAKKSIFDFSPNLFFVPWVDYAYTPPKTRAALQSFTFYIK